MNTELFEIRRDDKRNSILKRIYFMAIMFFIFTIITALFDILTSYKIYKFYSDHFQDIPNNYRVQSLVSMIFLVLYGMLLPLQAWLFYRFASQAKTLDVYNQPEVFYASLQWLLKQTIVAVILFGMNSIWAIFNFVSYYDLAFD